MKVYELAVDLKEARLLAEEGYGYESKAAAEKALAEDKLIDSYYRSQLKVIPVEIVESKVL